MEVDKDIIMKDISYYTNEFEDVNETEEDDTEMQRKILSYSVTTMQNEQIFLGWMKEGEKEEGKGEWPSVELEEVEVGSPREGNGGSLHSEDGIYIIYIYIYICNRYSSSCRQC